MGAKNHGVIMPDANKEYTINQVSGRKIMLHQKLPVGWRGLRSSRSAVHGLVDRGAGWGGQVLAAGGELPCWLHLLVSGYMAPGDIAGSYTARYILLYSQESYILHNL